MIGSFNDNYKEIKSFLIERLLACDKDFKERKIYPELIINYAKLSILFKVLSVFDIVDQKEISKIMEMSNLIAKKAEDTKKEYEQKKAVYDQKSNNFQKTCITYPNVSKSSSSYRKPIGDAKSSISYILQKGFKSQNENIRGFLSENCFKEQKPCPLIPDKNIDLNKMISFNKKPYTPLYQVVNHMKNRNVGCTESILNGLNEAKVKNYSGDLESTYKILISLYNKFIL